MRLLKTCLVFLVCVISSAKVSALTFEAYPSVLKTNLTSAASMICKVKDDGTHDIRRVTSIFISRDSGQDVASVTVFDPATALSDLGNLEVKGSLSDKDAEGMLELSWKDPSMMTLGGYTCFINGIDLQGHPVVLTGALHMTSVAPSIGDVVAVFNSKLQGLQNANQQQQNSNHQQSSDNVTLEIAKQQQQIDIQQQTIHNLTQEHTILQQQLTDQQQTIHNLETTHGNCSCKQQQHQISNLQLPTSAAALANLTQEMTHIKACTSAQSAFTAIFGTNHLMVVQDGQTVMFNKTLMNVGGHYNEQSGEFVCSTPGLYSFTVHAVHRNLDISPVNLQLKVNAATVTTLFAQFDDAASMGVVVELAQGDVVKVVSIGESRFHQYDKKDYQKNIFTGHLIQANACVA